MGTYVAIFEDYVQKFENEDSVKVVREDFCKRIECKKLLK